MLEKLFVYGTLGPERPNEHILSNMGGSFETASIKGLLKEEGWAAKMGYPGIVLDPQGDVIDGFIFSSEHLAVHWERLDKFEGDAYQRVLAEVIASNGKSIRANVYVLRDLQIINTP